MRTLNELIDVDRPAWPELSADIDAAELLGIGRESARQFDGVDPGFMGAL
ncbi:hypothetical protein OG523_02810 [Streptomyces virginiae]|nr:hypothetical protein [Streptomyces virginiae]MCX5174712.1 hypothetical protein [Streptomyces virginiae]